MVDVIKWRGNWRPPSLTWLVVECSSLWGARAWSLCTKTHNSLWIEVLAGLSQTLGAGGNVNIDETGASPYRRVLDHLRVQLNHPIQVTSTFTYTE